MKYVITILLPLAIVFQPITKFLIVTDYALNVKSITAKYCENKAKPKLKCNGKCHLKKQLIQHDKQSNQDKSELKESQPFNFYNSVSKSLLLPLKSQTLINQWTYLLRVSNPFMEVLFKPPVF